MSSRKSDGMLGELPQDQGREQLQKGNAPRAEFVCQELEWLRLNGTGKELAEHVAELRKKAPPRPAESTTGISRDMLVAARKTFQAGKAVHISYVTKQPIEFIVGDFAMNMPTIPLVYVRSPDYPPNGVRVVAYMLVSQGSGKAEPKAMHVNYEPCAFPTGMLEARYVIVGRIELRPATRIFIHVESLFMAPGKPGTILSNTVEIPVVEKK